MSSPFGYGQTYIPQYQQSQQSMAPSMAYGGMGNGIQGGPFGFQQKASASPFGMQQQPTPMMNGNPALSQAGPPAVPQGQGALLPVSQGNYLGLSGLQTDFKGFNPNANYFESVNAHIPGMYREKDTGGFLNFGQRSSEVAGNQDIGLNYFKGGAPVVDTNATTFDQAQKLYSDYINNLNYYKTQYGGQLDQLNKSYVSDPGHDPNAFDQGNLMNGYNRGWEGWQGADTSNKWVDYYKGLVNRASDYESQAQNYWNNIYNQYAQRGAFGAMG